jgi:signal transduction histidine kinase
MIWFLHLLTILLLPFAARAAERATQVAAWEKMSLAALETQKQTILQELERLAPQKVASGIGAVGFETKMQSNPRTTEWVEVDWGHAVPIDQVVLAPILWGVGGSEYTADGFPLEFRVIAGTSGDAVGTVIATFDERDGILPRSAPLVIPCNMTASWVRVEATVLSLRISISEVHNFQLSELMVFSGEENVALKQPCKSSSVGNEEGDRRSIRMLTDGFFPYEMIGADSDSSGAYMSVHDKSEQASLTIDLGAPTPINRIHLYPIESRQTAPRDAPTDFGIPEVFVIQGANREDFSDAVNLVERSKINPCDMGPIYMYRFPQSEYRYIRLTALQPHEYKRVFGFSEMEIFSQGQNVALGKPVVFSAQKNYRNKMHVNDGLTFFGRILPLKKWLGELARRHDLQTELPLVQQEIERRYSQQKFLIIILSWLIALALAGGAMAILIEVNRKKRQIAELRERFAADLHDELGANLYSIGLLAELAQDDSPHSKNVHGILDEIRRIAISTVAATKYRIAKQLHPLQINLPEDMRSISLRILANMDFHLEFDGEEHLSTLSPSFLDDLFLFYKECLINISRHSSAMQVRVSLHADPQRIHLEVADNGQGESTEIPPSLQRRAHLLRGKISVTLGAKGGTIITLWVRPKRKWLLGWKGGRQSFKSVSF